MGLEQRAGTRQTSPVAITSVSPWCQQSGGGSGRPLCTKCHRAALKPCAAPLCVPPQCSRTSFISPVLRVFALKMIYHTWQLPNFLNWTWGLVAILRGAVCRAVCRRYVSQWVASPRNTYTLAMDMTHLGADEISPLIEPLAPVLRKCSSFTWMGGDTKRYCFVYILLGKLPNIYIRTFDNGVNNISLDCCLIYLNYLFSMWWFF